MPLPEVKGQHKTLSFGKTSLLCYFTTRIFPGTIRNNLVMPFIPVTPKAQKSQVILLILAYNFLEVIYISLPDLFSHRPLPLTFIDLVLSIVKIFP
jgi:hypothetical protein